MNVEEDLTPEQLENVRIHYVKTISEVLELALPSSPRQEKLDAEEREKVLSEQPVG
jgi:ATP-dependent Lon protease